MQHDDEPSAVRDMYAPGETGLHHLAYFVDDLDGTARRLEAAGLPAGPDRHGRRRHPVRLPRRGRASSATCSSSTSPRPGLLGFYAMVAEAAEGWDGTRPGPRPGDVQALTRPSPDP